MLNFFYWNTRLSMTSTILWEASKTLAEKKLIKTSWCVAQFSSVQLLSRVQLFATPWIAVRQTSLSVINSGSSLRLMSIESVMPSYILLVTNFFFFLRNSSRNKNLIFGNLFLLLLICSVILSNLFDWLAFWLNSYIIKKTVWYLSSQIN